MCEGQRLRIPALSLFCESRLFPAADRERPGAWGLNYSHIVRREVLQANFSAKTLFGHCIVVRMSEPVCASTVDSTAHCCFNKGIASET